MPKFEPSKTRNGWPDPLCDDLRKLTDAELADYIAACGHDFDGMGVSAREALVRLLRRPKR